MSLRHAHALHDGIGAGLGVGLLTAHRAFEGRRLQDRSDAAAVASVDRLGRALQASRARETALARQVAELQAALQAEQARTRAALVRACRAEAVLVDIAGR